MSQNTRSDIKTLAYVLRRTNYGEADRILNLITPAGKMSAIVKGVRREKSKLAGGVEMFSLVELVVHQGRGEIGVVTSAKMVKYHGNLVADLARMELAGMILKKTSLTAEGKEPPEFFEIVRESLTELDAGADTRVVEAWFLINLLRVSGEEINLYRDASGARLAAGMLYDWDLVERAFVARGEGEFDENDIKLMRLMATSKLALVRRVKDIDGRIDKILKIIRNVV